MKLLFSILFIFFFFVGDNAIADCGDVGTCVVVTYLKYYYPNDPASSLYSPSHVDDTCNAITTDFEGWHTCSNGITQILYSKWFWMGYSWQPLSQNIRHIQCGDVEPLGGYDVAEGEPYVLWPDGCEPPPDTGLGSESAKDCVRWAGD